MRVVNENSIDLTRKSSVKSPLPKYIIVTEGDKTEQQYFKGIEENKETIGISSLIEICLVENDETESGHSNPLKKYSNFQKSLEEEKIIYFPETDRVCFIVDRDPKSFTEIQYPMFLKRVLESGYEPYISNPTFELFLLMHDDCIFDFDREEMLKNEYTTPAKNERFLEKKVREIFSSKKDNLKFDRFIDKIDIALINEKEFSEDIHDLKYNLGSNVGLLIEEMKSNKLIKDIENKKDAR